MTPRGTQPGPLSITLVAMTGASSRLITFVGIQISEADGTLAAAVLLEIMFIVSWDGLTNLIHVLFQVSEQLKRRRQSSERV